MTQHTAKMDAKSCSERLALSNKYGANIIIIIIIIGSTALGGPWPWPPLEVS